MQYYVITGGPGVGKTTLLEGLQSDGFETVAEDARALIKSEMQKNGNALPWADKRKYAIRMLEASIHSFKNVRLRSAQNVVFFDRSVVDALGYAAMEEISLPSALITAAKDCRYQKQVFILPPWAEIYKTDTERKQHWSEALHTFDCLKEAYLKLGYVLIEVPKGTVEERCRFVLERIIRKS